MRLFVILSGTRGASNNFRTKFPQSKIPAPIVSDGAKFILYNFQWCDCLCKEKKQDSRHSTVPPVQ